MNTDHNQTGTLYPQQMTKEEFARWWKQINDESNGPEKAPCVIYLGHDSLEEIDSL
jgi:glucose-6-phosphate isomerase